MRTLGLFPRRGAGTPVPVPPPVFTPYLDAYGTDLPKAAFALRKVKTGATYAITVRRSSDSTTLDIGFDASTGELDTVALLAFVGAGDGFVTRWYDQIAGLNLIQPVVSQQPRIVIGGALITMNGKPAIDFDQTNYPSQIMASDFTAVRTEIAAAFNVAFALDAPSAQPQPFPRLAEFEADFPEGATPDYSDSRGWMWMVDPSALNFAITRPSQFPSAFTAGSGTTGRRLITSGRVPSTSNVTIASGWSSFVDTQAWTDFATTPTYFIVGGSSSNWNGGAFTGRIGEINVWADNTVGMPANIRLSAIDLNTRFALGAVIP